MTMLKAMNACIGLHNDSKYLFPTMCKARFPAAENYNFPLPKEKEKHRMERRFMLVDPQYHSFPTGYFAHVIVNVLKQFPTNPSVKVWDNAVEVKMKRFKSGSSPEDAASLPIPPVGPVSDTVILLRQLSDTCFTLILAFDEINWPHAEKMLSDIKSTFILPQSSSSIRSWIYNVELAEYGVDPVDADSRPILLSDVHHYLHQMNDASYASYYYGQMDNNHYESILRLERIGNVVGNVQEGVDRIDVNTADILTTVNTLPHQRNSYYS